MNHAARSGLRRVLYDGLVEPLAAERAAPAWQAPGGDRWLAAIATVSLALSVLLYAIAGPHGAFLAINHAGRILPDALSASVTSLGGTLTAFVMLLIPARRHPALLWVALIALVVGGLLSVGLKDLLDTARPPALLPPGSFHLVGPAYYSHSTPSGHTITAFTLAGLAIRFARRARWRSLWLLAATLVGVSRVVVGVHWPLDVLLGAATGTLAAWLTLRIADAWRWGLRPAPHLALIALWCAFAVARLVHPGAYAEAGARPLGIALAAIALVSAAYGYLIGPWQAANGKGSGP